MQKTRKSMPGAEEKGMLKCEKREKACQGRRGKHAKMRKTRKSIAGIEEVSVLNCEKREKACQGQKKQAC